MRLRLKCNRLLSAQVEAPKNATVFTYAEIRIGSKGKEHCNWAQLLCNTLCSSIISKERNRRAGTAQNQYTLPHVAYE